MSYSIVNKVLLKKDGVYLSVASSNVYPRTFEEYRSDRYSEIFKEKGFTEVVKQLAFGMRDGTVQFRLNQKFCNCMLAAKAELESVDDGALARFLDGNTYSDYVTRSVMSKYERTTFPAQDELDKLCALRKSPEAVFTMCKENPEAFFYADSSIQENKDLCRRYVQEFAGELMFHFPNALLDDLDAVKLAVSKHGCVFRHLPERLRDNPDVVLAAFGAEKYPEHLPDLISPRLQNDVELMKKVIAVEPKLHFDRSSVLMSNPEFALCLAKNATWVNNFSSFPIEIRNREEIQKAMAARLHDDGLTPEQKERRLEALSQFVLPEYLVPEQLKDAFAFEYKGIVFDAWTIDDDGGIWGEMCDCCIEKHKTLISEELDDVGGFGTCSIRGCDISGNDCENSRYIDFKPELIHPLSREQLYERYPEHKSLDDKISAAWEQLASRAKADEPDRTNWEPGR